jgi:hypothetical protein
VAVEICDKIVGTKEEFEIYEFNIKSPKNFWMAWGEKKQLYHLIGALSFILIFSPLFKEFCFVTQLSSI